MADTTFQAHDPRTGAVLETYTDATDGQIAAASAVAGEGLPALRDDAVRAELLRAMARRLRDAADELHDICELETGLPRARLVGELERTCVQLELMADTAAEGSHVEAIIDTSDPDAPIAPRPDLRRMLVPLGPVAVFGASNFPYAFSVAGGDTASALAAGCPVVVKAHPSHPGTSEQVAACVTAAVAEVGLPAGTFSLLHGASSHVGEQLACAEEIAAVAFTGSLAGGRALFDAAASRERPIPVYAEMGSVNPTMISPGALRARSDAIAEGLTASITGGTGQFCTKPGVVLVPAGADGDAFVDDVVGRLAQVEAAPLLNARILSALSAALADLDRDRDVRRLSASEREPGDPEGSGGYLQVPVLFAVDAEAATRRPQLLQEHFGPTALMIRFSRLESALSVIDSLGGQLTGTLHIEADELEDWRPAVAALEELAGRVIFNGFPTGVAVTRAMQHGGPYPATTSLHTSVGTTAIRRFQRPVTWQNAPAELLPEALRDANPLGIWRLVNGKFTRDQI